MNIPIIDDRHDEDEVDGILGGSRKVSGPVVKKFYGSMTACIYANFPFDDFSKRIMFAFDGPNHW